MLPTANIMWLLWQMGESVWATVSVEWYWYGTTVNVYGLLCLWNGTGMGQLWKCMGYCVCETVLVWDNCECVWATVSVERYWYGTTVNVYGLLCVWNGTGMVQLWMCMGYCVCGTVLVWDNCECVWATVSVERYWYGTTVNVYGLLCLWDGTGMGQLGESHVPIPILPS